ncbi:hypothetical protein [Methylomicrobium lacus]|uniref:hypothetical protein n=1 Tax=Methylomicrobium lacus TaxID=136992 RepID=UPI0012678B01|nr:hypothetical protein [Methylomicrobium lacus]
MKSTESATWQLESKSMTWSRSLLKRPLKYRCLLAGIVLSLQGCGSFGPPSVDRDRFDYINAISSSWKQQTLLNIVKMRYADTPVFLDVGQIISGYQLQGALTVGASLNSASAVGDIVNLGSGATYTDRPTITYTPLTGAHFMQVMITPIPPPNLLRLSQEGWPIDMLLQIGAQSINGLSNRKGGARGHAAEPDFVRLLAALQRLQGSGVLGLRVEVSKESKQEGTVMVISQKDLPPEIQADRDRVRKLLGLRPDLQEFKVVSGTLSGKDDTIAIQTRSGFHILNLLGSNVEVPPEHIAEGRTYPQIVEPAETQSLSPLIKIHAENSCSADAFAAVKYRDYCYWIDDRDYRSKGVFTFLMIIMTLAETGEKAQPPVVTIQGN